MDYISYLRVSTIQQGSSKLGIEAQRKQIKEFAEHDNIIREFVEVESGSNNFRPVLLEAIQLVKSHKGSVLLIAKLDRLSRSLGFIATLMETQVKFRVVDMPYADSFTIHVIAAIAQLEYDTYSTRNRQALAILKARGVMIGNNINLTKGGRILGTAAIRRKAALNENNIKAKAIIKLLSEKKYSLSMMVEYLNDHHFQTSTGKKFWPTTVWRLMRVKP